MVLTILETEMNNIDVRVIFSQSNTQYHTKIDKRNKDLNAIKNVKVYASLRTLQEVN